MIFWNYTPVAPLVGARIEIIEELYQKHYALVAPLVGARIEIIPVSRSYWARSSRSPCGSED